VSIDSGGGTGGHDVDTGEQAGQRGGSPAPAPGETGPGRPPAKTRRHRLSWRAPVSAVLIVLGCVFAPLSVIAVWTANQVSDTNRYVANMAPLIKNPAIQRALTTKITDAIVARLNVKGLADQAAADLNKKGLTRLAGLLSGASGPLASGVDGYVHSGVQKVITSPRMAEAWTQVNRVAHDQLVLALSGRGHPGIVVRGGEVTLDLAPLIGIAKQDLSARGLTVVSKVPEVHTAFPLFPSKNLVKAQRAYRLLNDLKIVLPILTLVLLGLGVAVARRHRRALIGAGLGFAGSMLVLGAGLLIARTIYLNSVPPGVLPPDAAGAAFDILVRFIRTGLRALFVVGVVVAAGAFLTGPATTAVRVRGWFSAVLGSARRGGEAAGLRTGPVGRWTYAHRRALRIGAVVLAVLVFVFWGNPTVAVVIVIAVVLLVVLGLIELVGRPPAQPDQPSPASPDPASSARPAAQSPGAPGPGPSAPPDAASPTQPGPAASARPDPAPRAPGG
jgi:hypothetical protein